MILLLLLWAILNCAKAHENITCFQDVQECALFENNLVDIAIVTDWQECSQLCLNNSECNAFTFFGEASDFVPHSSCLMFSDCREKLPCNDCVVGVPQDDCLCSIGYLGAIDDSNFADLHFDVPDEATCKQLWTRCAQSTHTTIALIPQNLKPASFSQIPDLKRGQPSVNFARLGPRSARLNMSARQESSSRLMESPSATLYLRSPAFLRHW